MVIALFGAFILVNGQTEDKKQVWHLTVASRDDIGETAEKFKADLKEAFEERGDEVVDEASKESIDLNFYIGKDDDDDDNDGIPNDKDVGDGNGDGVVNEQDMAEVYDLDEEIPDVMKSYPDNEKDEGIYIYLEKETGLAMVFISKADSLKETEAMNLLGSFFFQNASFQRPNALMAEKTVADEVAKTVSEKRSSNLYVGNLSVDVTKEMVVEKLSKFGEVTEAGLAIDKLTNKSKGFGFFRMGNAAQAEKVIKELDGTLFNGRAIQVLDSEELLSSSENNKTNGANRKQRAAYRR